MTYKQALDNGIRLLEDSQIADARLDAWYLLSFVSDMSKAMYFLKQTEEMDESSYNRYCDLLQKRASHTPLQHLTGEQDFMGLTFRVNEHVLVPRQDTETLVEEALKVAPKGGHILDLCTGSGCVIISLVALGDELTGMGIDISDEALEVAKDNGERLVDSRVEFAKSDLWDEVSGRFHMIVSNPPYIRSSVIEELEPEVRDHEPRIALDGTEDGLLFYREITSKAPEFLKEQGWLLVEIGYDQGDDVAELFTAAGFKDVAVVEDLAGNDRVVKGHL